MAGNKNSGRKGQNEQQSGSNQGDTQGMDRSEAGRKGAEAQPIEAKRRGGENSHRGDSQE